MSRYVWRHPKTGKPGVIEKPDKILFRNPPQPYLRHGPPYKMIGCPMCGGKRYRLGWHNDWDGSGECNKGYWHKSCAAAHGMMQNPIDYWRFFHARQGGVCSLSGEPLGESRENIEIDHFVPLYQVYRDYREYDISDLLVFWGPENLRAVTKSAHKIKSKHEAAERAGKF